MEERIEIAAWERKDIFEFFSRVSNPFYMVTFRQDVTNLYAYVKKYQLSFYYALIYLCTQAVNRVEAFHYAIRQGEVYRLENRAPSFTDLKKGTEQFHIVTMPWGGAAEAASMEEFCRKAREKSQSQSCFLESAEETDRLIYFSCLPWLDITAVTNERDLAAPSARDESIPHIAWGKYVRTGERLELGLSLEVNHRLIDGVHIGQVAQELTRQIEALA